LWIVVARVDDDHFGRDAFEQIGGQIRDGRGQLR
jgi:hypothetical protein